MDHRHGRRVMKKSDLKFLLKKTSSADVDPDWHDRALDKRTSSRNRRRMLQKLVDHDDHDDRECIEPVDPC